MSHPQIPKKPQTPQEWEILIDDFQTGNYKPHISNTSTPLSLLTHTLTSLTTNTTSYPYPLKTQLLTFLDTYTPLLLSLSDNNNNNNNNNTQQQQQHDVVLSQLIQTLTLIIQTPQTDTIHSIKDQTLIAVTSIVLSFNEFCGVGVVRKYLEDLIGVLVSVINRPNHGVDRQIRVVACECLRELERELPCLLSEIVGHLWGICQIERTHAIQSYILLLLEVVFNIVVCKLNSLGSFFSTSVPLVPFNSPPWVVVARGEEISDGVEVYFGSELSGVSVKELKRVMAFLLDCSQVLTPCGMMEFMAMVMPVAVALELQTSLLKVQFFGLMYSYDPLLWHVVLSMCLRFPETFSGLEKEVCRRLVLVSKEGQHGLVFRLLVIHWLLGFVEAVSREGVEVKELVVGLRSRFYPGVYDALALKALKLDLLALCSVLVGVEDSQGGEVGVPPVKYFEDGLLCVSAFRWLPPWSTETAVAFRTVHKFLIGSSSHLDNDDQSMTKAVKNTDIFRDIKMMLVNLLLDYQKLVPVVVSLIDRLLRCVKHCSLGENLLQTVDEHMLPKVVIDYKLSSYFLILDRIGKNNTVPPQRLLELLTKYTMFLVEKHSPDTGLRSWSQGSKVLGVCRTMLMHHYGSRLFLGLSRLLALLSLYFPDLEVRDNARIYLRMLICVPGKKLRHLLDLGDQLVGISPSPHASSFMNVQSPRLSEDRKKSRSISSYIHVERVIPLLVKQSWSLSLPALGYEVKNFDGIKDSELGKDSGVESNMDNNPDNIKIVQPNMETLRVMDSKSSEIVDILRMHFSGIPDFRHMPGLKIKIFCTLRFRSDPFNRVWGHLSENGPVELSAAPAMYAVVLKFSSSAPYGSIPSYHIPFLFGESSSDDISANQGALDIIPVGTPSREKLASRSPVTIELEPREPIPGLVDVSIDANADNGQIIRGKLHGVAVGMEDMFLKAAVPAEIPEDAVPRYYSDLFNALWEACGASSNTGREMFSLKGGKGLAAIHGIQSVKLLEGPATISIRVIEQHLAPFVVSVIGSTLVEAVKERGIIKDVEWIDLSSDTADDRDSVTEADGGQLFLTYFDNEDNRDSRLDFCKTNMGCFLVLIFLPPRYHLLFRIEVSDVSTLVRIRTDHWPCLAYVDEYLEALFS